MYTSHCKPGLASGHGPPPVTHQYRSIWQDVPAASSRKVRRCRNVAGYSNLTSHVPEYVKDPSLRVPALEVHGNLAKLHQTSVVIKGFDSEALFKAWKASQRDQILQFKHQRSRAIDLSSMQQLPADPCITLWDSEYPKHYGSEIRGLECVEAQGAPVAFEVTGFTVTSKRARANVRLLGMQSDLDGSLVLAVRRPYIPLFRGSHPRSHDQTQATPRQAQTWSNVLKATGGGREGSARYHGPKQTGSGEDVEIDIPLRRPLRMRGHVDVIRM
eukprot:jgi/Ulvmu1/1736/UM117_0013.1